LGENEHSKQAIENAEKSINTITNGYSLAGTIGGLIALIAFFIWLFRQTGHGGAI
jgi:flagellar biogenesis protein FliO